MDVFRYAARYLASCVVIIALLLMFVAVVIGDGVMFLGGLPGRWFDAACCRLGLDGHEFE